MKLNPAKSSLSRRFNFSIIGVVILIALVFLVIITIVGNRNIEREMENRLTRIANIAESSLPPVIWNFDSEAIKSICESLFKEKGVVFLRLENVNDSNQPLFNRQEGLYSGKVFEFFKDSDQFKTKQSPIYYKGERVASFQLVFSKELLKGELIKNILSLILLIIIILGAIYWIVVLISKRNIFLPLKKLEYSAGKISKGELNTHISVIGEDEIGTLGQALCRMQQSIIALIEKLQKANKEKDKFLAEISHEARTPLNSINGFINLVLKTELQQVQRYKLELAASSTRNLIRIINDILDFSRMESGEFEILHIAFNFQVIIEEIQKEIETKIMRKDIKFVVEKTQNTPTFLKGDGGRLKQVLQNLLNNAIRHTNHGLIKLRISTDIKNDNIVNISFIVSDTGEGIPQEYHKKIFKPFPKIKEEYKNMTEIGAGLGLAISQKLVVRMGGKIELESEPNKGSTFSFTLPFDIQNSFFENAGSESLEKSIDFSILKDIHVLVAEDDPVNREYVEEILNSSGISADFVVNGKEAVEKVLSNNYDIILMDMGLPELSGPEVMEKIRQDSRFSNLPIIAVTADAIVGHDKEYLEAGASDYISKPFCENDLLSKILDLIIREQNKLEKKEDQDVGKDFC